MNLRPLLNWQRKAGKDRRLSFIRSMARHHHRARVYLVGGVVRDLLLHRAIKDLDFVITGMPKATLASFLKQYGVVNFVGKNFGVFKVTPRGWPSGEAIDVALPRLDLPAGRSGAYRDVAVISRATVPIEDDLKRRDFTVNAMAWNLADRRLIDPYNGSHDLAARRLKAVGDPATRFKEDFSRMLRGLRFAVELNFKIEAKTWRVLRQLIGHLNDTRSGVPVVPREVVARELLKAFYADPVEALALYERSGALTALVPELDATKRCPQPKPYHTEGTVWRHIKLALQALDSPRFRRRHPTRPKAELIMAVLLHDIGKPVCLKTPRQHGVDRIRFDGHDVAGGRLAREIAERLKLASPPADSYLHVDPEHLEWLIGHHLLLLHDAARHMKLTTIEKYFVRNPLGEHLKALILADSLASIPATGRPVLNHIVTLERTLARMSKHHRKLPASFLNGNEIMTTLGITAGPRVGLLLRLLREQQLLGTVQTKVQAILFMKREYERTGN